MSTSKQYPYFGMIDDQLVHASAIVHFTAPETGTTIWSSDPEKIKVGEVSTKWNETFFEEVVSPVTLAFIKTLMPMYVLLEESSDYANAVSTDLDNLKAEALRQTISGYLMWEQIGNEILGRTQDQNRAVWVIRPIDVV